MGRAYGGMRVAAVEFISASTRNVSSGDKAVLAGLVRRESELAS